MYKKNPLVSILIPAYNHENYIQGTIKSIINQTYQNIELLIIDDGSKDSTYEKINELKDICTKRFKDFKFKTHPNCGTCETLNELIKEAKGKYILPIASDDLLKPQSVEKQVNFLEKHKGYVLCVGDNEIIDSQGKKCYWDLNLNNLYESDNASYISYGDYLQKVRRMDFKKKNFGKYHTLFFMNYIPNGYLIRKSTFKRTGLYTKEAPLEDWYMNMQLSKYGKFKYIDEILCSYRWHNENTVKNREKMWDYTLKTKSHELKILKKLNIFKVRYEAAFISLFVKFNKLDSYCNVFLPRVIEHLEKLVIKSKKEDKKRYYTSKINTIETMLEVNKMIKEKEAQTI